MTGPLIEPGELAEKLGEYALFDLRWSLTDPGHGIAAYARGHLPGAVFVDLDRDLAAPEGDGRHPLPPIEVFVATLGRLGIGRKTPAVVYDDMAGAVAARMWWMLESIGHEAPTRLLDGGIQAWVELGLPVESGILQPNPTSYPEVDGYRGMVRHDQLEGRAIADVRAPERYRGEVEPVDPRAGHIPGAVNYPLSGNLRDGRFLEPRLLAERYREFPDDGVVSCGSGVNACHMALALVLAGRPMPDLYVGSFSDWSRRDLPVATGADP